MVPPCDAQVQCGPYGRQSEGCPQSDEQTHGGRRESDGGVGDCHRTDHEDAASPASDTAPPAARRRGGIDRRPARRSGVGLLGFFGRCLDVVGLDLVDGVLDDGVGPLERLLDSDLTGVGDQG
jgi:hypothetical protein